MTLWLRAAVYAVLFVFLSLQVVRGETCILPTETTDPILISISYDEPQGMVFELDINALQSLPLESFDTSTIWTDGIQTFQGVRLKVMLDCLNVESGVLTLIAQNDYSVEIPYDEIDEKGQLLAFARNGDLMTLRDKGPIWLVYPYDQNPIYQTEKAYSRSIWQLDRIIISR